MLVFWRSQQMPLKDTAIRNARHSEKLTKAISTATTFKAVAEEFIDKKIRERKADSTISKNRYSLELAYPFIGTRPVAEIKCWLS